MTKGIGELLSKLFGSFAVDQDRARIQGPGRGAEEITGIAPEIKQIEIQPLESNMVDVLLDGRGLPVLRDENMMQSEFADPYIFVGDTAKKMKQERMDAQPELDIRDLLNMLFNRG